MVNNEFQASIDADQFVTDMITLSAAADDFTFQDNYVFGAVNGETALVDRSILTGADAAWLNDYHRTVWEKLWPSLDEAEKAWLRKATAPI